MPGDLTFYTNPMSRGRIVRWMLEEVGEPYETVILDYGTTMKGADYLAVNPMGKVPAIKHRGVVVTEAAAICAYLADAFPAAGLAPASGSPERGPYYRWLFFAAGPGEAVMTAKSLNLLAPPDKAGQAGYGSLEATVNALEYAVSQSPYLTGDSFTAADLYVGSQLNWATMWGLFDKRPAFQSYIDRISDRPAARRAREIDDALVAEAKAREPAQ